jgi:hypothetical protein
MSASLTNFFTAWTTSNADSRRDLIASAVSGGFYYVDPMTSDPITDVDGMDAYMANFLGMCPPGASVFVRDPIDEKLGHVRATVVFEMSPDMQQIGQYFVDLDTDGKLSRMIGYAGKGAA